MIRSFVDRTGRDSFNADKDDPSGQVLDLDTFMEVFGEFRCTTCGE